MNSGTIKYQEKSYWERESVIRGEREERVLVGVHVREAHSEGLARTETKSRSVVCSRGLKEARGTGAGSKGRW